MTEPIHDSMAQTLYDHGAGRLQALCAVLELDDKLPGIRALFQRMIAPWGAQTCAKPPRWASDVGDDHTPYELSVAFDEIPELRILIEPLGEEPSLESNRERALEIHAWLARDFEIDLSRFEQVRDLFLPQAPQGAFSIWHGVSFRRGKPPAFKIYLNPQAQGATRAPSLVEEALSRLGLPRAWPHVTSTAMRRGPALDELKYLSLDLSKSGDARVKVYVRHHRATIEELEMACSAALSYRAGDVTAFIQRMSGQENGLLTGRPTATCLSFVGGTEQPTEATHHFPVKGYAANDLVVAERVSSYLESRNLDAEIYRRSLRAFARSPLDGHAGVQSYASLRHPGGKPRVTVYLAPELHHPGIQPSIDLWHPESAEDLVRLHERASIAEHPLMRRLRREPVNLYNVWKVIANAEISIVEGFARRLAHVTARVDDDRIRSILAHQLDDELGEGNFAERGHSVLFKRMVSGLDPWRPDVVDSAMLAPARRLNEDLDAIYFGADPYEAVGAAMLLEVFGKQTDQFFGDELRRQKQVEPSSLEWLTMHEELEIDHAEESMLLARMMPADKLEAICSGFLRTHAASWRFFDGIHAVCYR